MKSIRLRFVTGTGIVSGAIRWFGAGMFSHVGAITDDDIYEYGARSDIEQSTSGKAGVQMRPLNYAVFTRSETVVIPCLDKEHEFFWRAMLNVKGWPYSGKTILGEILGRDLDDIRGFDCSALCSWALGDAGMMMKSELPRERLITPDWLYGYASGLRQGRIWSSSPFVRGVGRRTKV